MPKHSPSLPRETFERLVRDHHAAVYASSLRLVRDPALAADVTQRVYVALLEGRFVVPTHSRSGDELERALRWYAVRTSLSEMRASVNRRRREDDYAMRHDESSARAARTADTQPDEAAAARDEARFLQRAIDQLPDDLRVPLRLRFDEECTYATIGDALAISEPSAHERVRRALERLRDAFTQGGRGALALAMEQRLVGSSSSASSTMSSTASSTASTLASSTASSSSGLHGWPHASLAPAAVPAQLAPRLLSLHGGATAVVTSTSLAVASVLAFAATAVLWVGFASSRSSVASSSANLESVTAVASVTHLGDAENTVTESTEPRAAGRAPVDAVAPEPASAAPVDASSGAAVASETKEGRGTIRGVLLSADGSGADARVVGAWSVERDGKFPRWSALARTRADGAFTIEVPIGEAGATNYLVAPDDGGKLESDVLSIPVRAVANGVVDAGVLKLAPTLRDEPGHFTLDVRVVDADGHAVPNAVVVLSRRVRTKNSFGPTTWEAGGRVDAGGSVHFVGEHVGDKHLVVDARDAGYRKLERDLVVESGARTETITLERALEIRGRLLDVEERPIRRPVGESRFGDVLRIHTSTRADGNDWILADIDDDGSFVLRGLDPGSYALGVAGGAWSPICRDGVRAGDMDVVVHLKRTDDARDVGDHCAEIHLRVVDAVTHAPVNAGFDVAEAIAIDPATSDAAFRADVAPLHVWEAPVQKEDSGTLPPPSDRVHLVGLAGGTYAVAVRIPGFAPAIVGPIRLAPREVRADLVVELRAPVRVAGRVLDRDGRPVAGAWVAVGGSGDETARTFASIDEEVRSTDGRPLADMNALVKTDAQGRFAIEGLPPDLELRLGAFHLRSAPVTSGVVAPAERGAVELRFVSSR